MHFSLHRVHLRILAACLGLVVTVSGNPPLWWTDGNPPILTGGPENNHGPANIGQAKWMVSEALRALDAAAPDIASQVRADLAGTPPDFPDCIIRLTIPAPEDKTPEWTEKQKAPLLIGQLKAIADPFYTRLHAIAPAWLEAERAENGTESGGIFPWTADSARINNFAMANIGQLKAIFSLQFETFDADGDGLPDGWEILFGLDPNDLEDAQDDPDADGLDNLNEYFQGRLPRFADQDADFYVDGGLGNDVSFDGSSASPGRPSAQSGPKKTITGALTSAVSGDSIILLPSLATYAEPILVIKNRRVAIKPVGRVRLSPAL